MKRDEIDALLVAGFFLGYAIMLGISRRVPRPRFMRMLAQRNVSVPVVDNNRLTFWRGIRDALIREENMTDTGEIAHAD